MKAALIAGSTVIVVFAAAALWLKLGGYFEAGPTQVTWDHTYGGPGRDEASRVVPTTDGGTIVAGGRSVVNADGTAQLDAWVIHLDAAGNTVWERTWGGPDDEHIGDIQPVGDDGFVVTGETEASTSGLGTVWVVRLAADGQTRWQHAYEAKRKGALHSVLPTPDGGYVVVGAEQVRDSNYYDGWAAKIDVDGNLLWERFLGGADDESIAAVKPTPDGGYILVGSTQSKGAGRSDAWIVRLDADGKLLWDRTYGGAQPDEALDVLTLSDHGFIVAGWSDAKEERHKRDGWLLQVDAQGTLQWEHFYGGFEMDEAHAIRPTNDGGYVVAGATRSKGAGGDDVWVFKVDSKGALQWERALGGRDADAAFGIAPMLDGAYVVVGQAASKGAGREDAWVLRLNALGQLN